VNLFPTDAPTQQIVDDAVAASNTLGAAELGKIGGPLKRAKFANGTTENRGGESDLGNLVAEVQKWATRNPESGEAQIAFMNPGGLRADMLGVPPAAGDPDYPRVLTYKQAAVVQPFANTLVNMDLTGAQIKTTLEQQWQPAGSSRPFLKLGISKGFLYTSDPTKPAGQRITGMWLDGAPISPSTVYSVTVNSFLATGGDNFFELNNGAGKQDTGKTDLQGMVEYMAEFANTAEGDSPLPVPTKQNGVGVAFPVGAPAAYDPGQHVTFDVSGWSFTSPSDPRDTQVVVKSGATTLGTFPLNNTAPSANPTYDDTGRTTVDVVVPVLPPGVTQLTLVGPTTGTEVTVPITVGKSAATVVADDATAEFGKPARVIVTVTGPVGAATGTVEVFDGTTSLATAPVKPNGKATVLVPTGSFSPGTYTLRADYSGDGNYNPGSDTLTLTVTPAPTTVTAVDTTVAYGKPVPVKVTLGVPKGTTPSGTITLSEGGTQVGSATVSAKTTIVSVPAGTLGVGVHTLDVAYSGDGNFAPGSTTVQVTITKAASTIATVVTPKRPRTGQDTTLDVTVSGAGAQATGDVQVSVDGGTPVTQTLSGGTTTVPLGSFTTPGTHTVTVEYLGSDTLLGSTKTITVNVR
jgi:5'-nucleotidase